MDNEKDNIMEIIDENGNNIEIEVLAYFNMEDDPNDYILYRIKSDENELAVYASIVEENENEISLKNVTNPERVEQMKKMIEEIGNDKN